MADCNTEVAECLRARANGHGSYTVGLRIRPEGSGQHTVGPRHEQHVSLQRRQLQIRLASDRNRAVAVAARVVPKCECGECRRVGAIAKCAAVIAKRGRSESEGRGTRTDL
jgi:hypothetical protein